MRIDFWFGVELGPGPGWAMASAGLVWDKDSIGGASLQPLGLINQHTLAPWHS